MSKHTDLPWKIEDRTPDGQGYTIHSPTAHFSHSIIGEFLIKSDADFIVRACNAHEGLVAALSLISSGTVRLTRDACAKIARGAIAKAEVNP